MNIGHFFYKGWDFSGSSVVEELLRQRWSNYIIEISRLKQDVRLLSTHIFSALVGSEGMLVGSSLKPYGAALEQDGTALENSEVEDVKAGMYFDHSSGLPLVKGHGIKGGFKMFLQEDPEYIFGLATESTGVTIELIKKSINIFMGDHHDFAGLHQIQFLDAVPVSDNDSPVLVRGIFTPHKKEIYKNPDPLMHVRVAPRSRYWFPFINWEPEIANSLNILFPVFLRNYGLGAYKAYNLGLFEEVVMTINQQ